MKMGLHLEFGKGRDQKKKVFLACDIGVRRFKYFVKQDVVEERNVNTSLECFSRETNGCLVSEIVYCPSAAPLRLCFKKMGGDI